MNLHLLKAIAGALLYGILCIIPQNSSAQCLCEGGVAPTPIEHIVVLDTINTSSTTISFPKFDPSIGTLSCIRLNDTVSVVSKLGIKNRDPETILFSVTLTVGTSVTGPSLSRNDPVSKGYGPDSLQAFGNPGDSIGYGPDTLFNNKPSVVTNTSNMVPYIGLGNVNLTYSVGGGTFSFGGANYLAEIRTSSWGIFKLTYYWCESTPLANNIKDFSAVLKDNLIQLKWMVNNDAPFNKYQIQTSHDGKSFQTIGEADNADVAKGASTEYEYQFNPGQVADGKLYFRIKQFNGNTVKYSLVKTISRHNSIAGLTIFPNPMLQDVNVAFNEPVNGILNLKLSNLAGQVVYSRRINMDNAYNLQLRLPDPPPAGIYYLRAVEGATGKSYSGKLIVRR